MGLSWQQGPLAAAPNGRFLVARPLPDRLLFAEPLQTFCPYKGLASYYTVGDARRAAWPYREAWPEVAAVRDLVSFEPDEVEVRLDGRVLHLERGQKVTPHGIDRGLTIDEVLDTGAGGAHPTPGVTSRTPTPGASG